MNWIGYMLLVMAIIAVVLAASSSNHQKQREERTPEIKEAAALEAEASAARFRAWIDHRPMSAGVMVFYALTIPPIIAVILAAIGVLVI